MALLAPLDHNPSANHLNSSNHKGGGNGVNIPSLELLQQQNKLQPLNYVPNKKGPGPLGTQHMLMPKY